MVRHAASRGVATEHTEHGGLQPVWTGVGDLRLFDAPDGGSYAAWSWTRTTIRGRALTPEPVGHVRA